MAAVWRQEEFKRPERGSQMFHVRTDERIVIALSSVPKYISRKRVQDDFGKDFGKSERNRSVADNPTDDNDKPQSVERWNTDRERCKLNTARDMLGNVSPRKSYREKCRRDLFRTKRIKRQSTRKLRN